LKKSKKIKYYPRESRIWLYCEGVVEEEIQFYFKGV